MNKILLVSFLIVSLYGCKTAEEIQREKLVDTMAIQMVDLQKMAGELTVRVQNIDHKIGNISGQIEETDHAQKMGQEDINKRVDTEISLLKNNISDISKQQTTTSNDLRRITKELEQQRAFIDRILNTLKKVADDGGTKTKTMSPYEKAMSDYEKGSYDQSYPALQDLLNAKNMTAAQKARILHNLGVIATNKKNYDDGMVYFSRLFTEYPNSTYNKNGLFQLGKIFQNKNESSKARQTWQQLISKWPESSSAKNAKTEMTKLK